MQSIEHVVITGKIEAEELDPFLKLPHLKWLTISQAVLTGDRDTVLATASKNLVVD